MKRIIRATIVAALVFGHGSFAGAADESEAKAILDKGIKALGGEAKFAGKALNWKSKGSINIGGNENEFVSEITVQGLDRFRGEFEGNFGGQSFKGVTVLNGDKGWRRFGDMGMEMDKDSIVNERRSVYLQVIPASLVPLKGNDFKIESAGEEKVGDAVAVGIKITGPEGKDFKLFFDKQSGLPVKQVATVLGFMGEEFTQETTFGSYKDYGGVKKSTKIESKRDGERFVTVEVTDFTLMEKVDPKTFAEPQ
jgi:hypothetical protein